MKTIGSYRHVCCYSCSHTLAAIADLKIDHKQLGLVSFTRRPLAAAPARLGAALRIWLRETIAEAISMPGAPRTHAHVRSYAGGAWQRIAEKMKPRVQL